MNRISKLTTCLLLTMGIGLFTPLFSPVRAEDAPADTLAAPNLTISAEVTTPILSIPVKADVPAKIIPAENNEAILAKRSGDYFRNDCDPVQIGAKSSGFSFFSNKSDPLYGKCIDDLARFEETFPGRSWVADALWRSSELEHARKKYPQEAIALAKVRYLYNDPSLLSKAESRLLRMAADDLKGERKTLKLLATGPTAIEAPARHLELLQQFGLFEGREFLPLLRKECDFFLKLYPTLPEAETVLALREESLNREKEFSTYALGLRLLTTLYPQSPARVSRLAQLGLVQSKELKEYKEAVATYEQLLRDYPLTPDAEAAYLSAAVICDEELKEYTRAIDFLTALVRDFPKSDKARDSLDYQAKIYQKKMKEPLMAIKSYRRLVEMFPGQAAIKALNEAADLARTELKDYDEQIALQEELVSIYPQSPEAVPALYEIAETQEEKLKDIDKALVSYQRLVDLYPSTPLAEKARARLLKAQGK